MLIFFDIDGTLIDNRTRVIPESAGQAIRRARENGHICMINTGRTKRLVGTDVLGRTEFDGLLLGCGTMITCGGETLFHKTFSAQQAVRIQEGLRRFRIDALLEGAENDFIQRADEVYHASYARYLKKYADAGFGSYRDALGRFDKLYVYVEDAERMAGFREEFEQELDFIDRLHGYYEVLPKGCSKASAMEFVAAKLGIPMSQTAAIGDSSNDIPMLECAGVAIAMGNAVEEVKSMADYVSSDVQEDGIRRALEWLKVL